MRINKKCFAVFAAIFVLILMTITPSASVFAASDTHTLSGLPSRHNALTGYSAVIADEADLLTSAEEEKLLDEMYPLTEYANIAIYTVDTYTSLKDYERARQKRVELFGSTANAAIFTIDMYLRRIVIQRRGNMESYFNNSRANNITNNVASLATQKKYYSVCSTAMNQMYSVIQGRAVPEPMRYLSNGVIALMLGCITAFIVALSTSSAKGRSKKKNTAAAVTAIVRNYAPLDLRVKSFRTIASRTVVSSSSSGSSCSSSCSSSSCGSSCSSGSSCGSSCGGSSF